MQWTKVLLWFRNRILFSFVIILVCVTAAEAQQPSTSGNAGASATPAQKPPASAPSPLAPANKNPLGVPGLDSATGVPFYETIQEDWTNLQIGASKLKPEPPVFGEVDQEETFSRVLVQLKWRPGDPIDLWVILPKGVKKPPAVLYLYGFDQDTDRFRDNSWCRRATSNGVAAIGFVSAMTGQRFHDRPMRQWFISELPESLGSTVHDVHFILDFLAQQGDVDMDRIGMFGEGSGGAIAILAAASDPRIKVVDTLEPWGDWPVFLAKSSIIEDDPEHRHYDNAVFLKKAAPLDPVKWLPKLKTPIRVQQILESEAVPLEAKEKIRAAAPKQAEVVRFEEVLTFAKRESQGRMFDWIKGQLIDLGKPGAGNGSTKVATAAKPAPSAASGKQASAHQ